MSGMHQLTQQILQSVSKALKQAFSSQFVLIRPISAGISRPITSPERVSTCSKIKTGWLYQYRWTWPCRFLDIFRSRIEYMYGETGQNDALTPQTAVEELQIQAGSRKVNHLVLMVIFVMHIWKVEVMYMHYKVNSLLMAFVRLVVTHHGLCGKRGLWCVPVFAL